MRRVRESFDERPAPPGGPLPRPGLRPAAGAQTALRAARVPTSLPLCDGGICAGSVALSEFTNIICKLLIRTGQDFGFRIWDLRFEI